MLEAVRSSFDNRPFNQAIAQWQTPLRTGGGFLSCPFCNSLQKLNPFSKGTILWCPIAAVVEPQVQLFFFRNAARAFTLLLKTLI